MFSHYRKWRAIVPHVFPSTVLQLEARVKKKFFQRIHACSSLAFAFVLILDCVSHCPVRDAISSCITAGSFGRASLAPWAAKARSMQLPAVSSALNVFISSNIPLYFFVPLKFLISPFHRNCKPSGGVEHNWMFRRCNFHFLHFNYFMDCLHSRLLVIVLVSFRWNVYYNIAGLGTGFVYYIRLLKNKSALTRSYFKYFKIMKHVIIILFQ